MSWLTSLSDLRNLLSDNEKDKLRYRKRCIGYVTGANTTFKTFEFRRINDFTTSVAPVGVYVDGVLVPVSADFSDIGEFTLATAPAEGSVVEATYYIQWFIDSELTKFLEQASEWLGQGVNYDNTPEGLRPCLLFYAAKQACEKLSLRWAEYLSDTYMMQDAPNADKKTPVQEYMALAKMYKQQAEDAQKNYYTRQGQNLQPLFASIPGRVRDPQPKR